MQKLTTKIKWPKKHEYQLTNKGTVYSITVHTLMSGDVCPTCKKKELSNDLIIESEYDPSIDKTTINKVTCKLHGDLLVDCVKPRKLE